MLTRSKWLAGLAASALAVSLAPVIGLSTASAAERPDSLGKDFWVAFLRTIWSTQSCPCSSADQRPPAGRCPYRDWLL